MVPAKSSPKVKSEFVPWVLEALERVNSSYLDLRESYSFYSSGEVAFLLDLQIFPMWDSDPLSLIGS